MATFIQLINDVARESGTMGGQTLATVANASGRWTKIVAWTRQAWEMIQRERSDWTFLRDTFEANLVASQARYTPAELGLFTFGSWEQEVDGYTPYSLFDPAIGRGDETRLPVVNYRAWAVRYDFGAPDVVRPNVVTFDFQRRLCVGPVPDKVYTIRGAYRRSIQALTADADVPYIHEDYHQAIVWRALVLLGEDDEAAFEVGSSAGQYRAIRSAMLKEYTEGIST